jgi:hypothetical protein
MASANESLIDKKILRTLAESADGFARELEKNVANFYASQPISIRQRLQWRYVGADDLYSHVETQVEAGNIDGSNIIYWRDIESSILAIRRIFINRSLALLESALTLLNRGDLLSSAVITRSFFELALWMLHHSATFKNSIDALPPASELKGRLVDASALQTLIVKLIWGTRLKDRTKNNTQLEQLKLIKELDKIKKRDPTNYIEPMYEYLSELCHPNVLGNFLFVEVTSLEDSDSTDFTIINNQTGIEATAVIEKVCSCISWSTKAIMNAEVQFEEAISLIHDRFPLNSKVIQ